MQRVARMTKRRIVKISAAAVAIAVLSALIVRSCRKGDPGAALRASGVVEATEVHLGVPASGRLETVTVHEGDAVEAGKLLARLDQAELLAKRSQAQAQVSAARVLLAELERGSRPEEIRTAMAARDAARARLDEVRRNQRITSALYRDRVATRDELDRLTSEKKVAEEQLDQAQQQLALVRTGPRRERIEAQRSQVQLAQAAVEAANAAIANSTVIAPIDGVITTRHCEPGEIVPQGTAIVTMMNPADRWVRIYVAETRIAAVRLGARATITSDTYPDARYAGEVSYIASEAEFTPKNVQTEQERVKLVYAVKVRITGDPDRDLKPGIPADVELDLRRPEGQTVHR